jgi:hypothetical protein
LTTYGRADYFNVDVALREKRRNAALANNLALVKQIDYLAKEISNYYLENRLDTSKARSLMKSNDNIIDVEAQITYVHEGWSGKLAQLRSRRAKDDSSIISRGKVERDWGDALLPNTLPPRYRKYSGLLLDMHNMKRRSIGAKDLDSAKALDRCIARLKKVEEQRQRESFFESNERCWRQLEARTTLRREARKSDWNRRIQETAFKQNLELRPLHGGLGLLIDKALSKKAEDVGEEDGIVNGHKTRGLTVDVPGPTLQGVTRPVYRTTVPETTKHIALQLQKRVRSEAKGKWP